MTVRSALGAIGAAGSILALPTARTVEQASVPCAVTITAPKPGDQVTGEGEVRGIARVPNGTYLWVLAHPKAYAAEWWPQGGRPALIEPEGGWVIVTAYGRPRDVGKPFEVAVAVVDAGTNSTLLDWVKTAKEREYPPIAFPPTAEGCVPVKVTVTKTAH
jgi:hypothetical protein